MQVWACFLAALALTAGRAAAADLTEPASRAFADYVTKAQSAFVDRAMRPSSDRGESAVRRDETPLTRPGGGDGILDVPGGLIHHWRGEIFIPGVTLDRVIAVSRAYHDYPAIYRPVSAATVLSEDKGVVRVQFRMRSSAGGLSATLDVRTRVEYVRVDERRAHSVSFAEEIREVKDPGRPNERRLPEGHDSGYLWRAHTLTHFVAEKDGVFIAMETLGLSRQFPPLTGWIIEPIARRLGRKSVEGSLDEFLTAIRRSAALPAPKAACA